MSRLASPRLAQMIWQVSFVSQGGGVCKGDRVVARAEEAASHCSPLTPESMHHQAGEQHKTHLILMCNVYNLSNLFSNRSPQLRHPVRHFVVVVAVTVVMVLLCCCCGLPSAFLFISLKDEMIFQHMQISFALIYQVFKFLVRNFFRFLCSFCLNFTIIVYLIN